MNTAVTISAAIVVIAAACVVVTVSGGADDPPPKNSPILSIGLVGFAAVGEIVGAAVVVVSSPIAGISSGEDGDDGSSGIIGSRFGSCPG